MINLIINETVIREYLLGRIGPEEEVSTQFDEKVMTDPEFSLLVDVIEDEIIEEYLDGVLTAADVGDVEAHFLLPPQRQQKLRGMRLISSRLADARERSQPAEAQGRPGSPQSWWAMISPSVKSWAEIGAGLALAACTIYFWNQQRELRLVVEQNRQELAQWKQAQSISQIAANQPAVVMINLIVPGLSRGEQALPEARLTADSKTLHVSVALTAQPAGGLRVWLKQADEVLWVRNDVEARPVPGGALLALDVPTAVVPTGTCRLIVSGPGRGQVSYWFRVSKRQ